MRTCSNCEVELAANMNFCPLCGEPMMDESSNNYEYIKLRKQKQEEKLLSGYQKLSGSQKRKLFWEISGIILLSAIIVTFLIDLMGGNNITWSRYSIAVCAALFVNITVICFWIRKIILMFAGSFVSSSAFLLLLDLLNGSVSWGTKLGVPLLLASYVIVFVLVFIIRKTKTKELNLIAYSLIAVGLLSVCFDAIIANYTGNPYQIHWSLVVVASIIPVASLLLYIQFRLKKETDLKRFFHI